jgi:fibronectin-binding autotransporter adhesin
VGTRFVLRLNVGGARPRLRPPVMILLLTVMAFTALLATAGVASALTYTWTGGGGSGDTLWSSSANWDANGVPANSGSNTVNFPTSATNRTVTYDVAFAGTGTVSFAGTGWTLQPSVAQTLWTTGIFRVETGANLTSTLPITISANRSLTVNGTLNQQAAVSVTGAAVALSLGGSGTTNVSGVISGTGGINKTGTGTSSTVTLSGNNTYRGVTTSAGGTMTITGTWANGGTTLQFAGAGNISVSGAISGTGGRTKTGGGKLTLSGSNSYSGSTAVQAGILQASKTGALPGWNVAGKVSVSADATLAVEGTSQWLASSIDTLRSKVSWSLPSYLGIDTTSASGGSYTYNSDIATANMGINKLGTGTLVLGGENTFTGPTLVSAGVLTVAKPASLPGYDTGSPAISVADAATLAVAVGSGSDWLEGDIDVLCNTMSDGGWQAVGAFLGVDTSSGNFTYSSSGMIGDMGLSKIGSNTLEFSGPQYYTGKTKVTGGTVLLSVNDALPTTSDVQMSDVTDAILDVNGHTQIIGALSGGGSSGGDVHLGSGYLTSSFTTGIETYSGVISGTGSFEKSGDAAVPTLINGVLTLTGNNTYTGPTKISGGTLRINNEVRIGADPGSFDPDHLLFTNGGTLEAYGTFTIDDSNRGVTLGNGGGVIQVDPTYTLTVAEPITGDGSLTKTGTGTLVLTTGNDYTGSTTILEGTVQINSASCLGADITGPDAGHLTLNAQAPSSAVLHVTGNANITDPDRGLMIDAGGGTIDVDGGYKMTVTGNASGTGPLTKSGSGELSIAGATGDYSGLCVVEAGTLRLNGTFDAASSVIVAEGATLAGIGDTNGSVDVSGTIDPGTAAGVVGRLSAGSTIFEDDMQYPVQMTDAMANWQTYPGTGYDLYDITGDLQIAATSGQAIDVTLTGTPVNYSSTGVYRWPIVRFSGSITGWNPALFSLDYSGFTPPGGLGGRVPAIEYNPTTKTIDIVLGRDPTAVTVTSFRAYLRHGHVVASFKTASLGDSIGFNVYRKSLSTGKWIKINSRMIAAKLARPAGATYRIRDSKAPGHRRLTYRVKEAHSDNSVSTYGPFRVRPSAKRSSFR